ncbi:MAG: hypothetical protein HOP07_04670 [Bacteriovoracaceae bacterium]|nr:hypothetical protein [Bacteriovoracaceae bacterium]
MKKLIILMITVNLWSCGKTKMDSSTSSANSLQSYTCAQLPECAKTCYQPPPPRTDGNMSWTNPNTYDSSKDPCMTKSVQIINGVIVNVK